MLNNRKQYNNEIMSCVPTLSLKNIECVNFAHQIGIEINVSRQTLHEIFDEFQTLKLKS